MAADHDVSAIFFKKRPPKFQGQPIVENRSEKASKGAAQSDHGDIHFTAGGKVGGRRDHHLAWKRKKGRRIRDWHVALFFKQKTKLVASRGSIKRNATCILPVFGTMIAPSFGDPSQLMGKQKKKRR